MAQAHGRSAPVRRAVWLAAVAGLAAVGCAGPDKKDDMDPALKQKLLGLGQPPAGKSGTGSAALDERFNRTTPTRLPSPQLASSPAPAAPSGPTLPPGSAVATLPTNPATMPLQPSEVARQPQPPQPQPLDPITRTGATMPVQPMPPTGLPTLGGTGLPAPSGFVAPPPPMPLSNLNPPEPPPALPTVAPLPPIGGPFPPLPDAGREQPLQRVPTFPSDVPPLVK